MNITIKIDKKKASRPDGRFAQVLNHVEYTKRAMMKIQNILDFPPPVEKRVNDIASVRQLVGGSPVTMTPALQKWLLGLFRESAPPSMSDAEVLKCYSSTLKGHTAFTNRTGWDTMDEKTDTYIYQDVNLGTGMGKKGWKLQPCISHGATIKVLYETVKAGEMCVAFEILDANDPETLKRTYSNSRHLIFPAISWHRFPLPFGVANPFPKLEDNDVPIPLLGNGVTVGYLPLQWVRYMSDEETYPANPYWRQ